MKNFKDNDKTDYTRSLGFAKDVAQGDTLRVFSPPTTKDERDFTLRALVNAVEDLRTVPTFNRLGDVYRALDEYENAVIAAGDFR